MREVLLLCWRDTGHPQGGGSERYLEQVGSQLAERGIKVTLRTASYPGAPASEVRDGITISRAGGRFSVYPALWPPLPPDVWVSDRSRASAPTR